MRLFAYVHLGCVFGEAVLYLQHDYLAASVSAKQSAQ